MSSIGEVKTIPLCRAIGPEFRRLKMISVDVKYVTVEGASGLDRIHGKDAAEVLSKLEEFSWKDKGTEKAKFIVWIRFA